MLTKTQALKITIMERTPTNNEVVVLVCGKKVYFDFGHFQESVVPKNSLVFCAAMIPIIYKKIETVSPVESKSLK